MIDVRVVAAAAGVVMESSRHGVQCLAHPYCGVHWHAVSVSVSPSTEAPPLLDGTSTMSLSPASAVVVVVLQASEHGRA